MSIKKHIPNAITCCNLICGCIATYNAFCGLTLWALAWIVMGAVFDFFDGMSARLLHVSSPIGKELDSLADDITFGFAPSAIVYTLFNMFYYPPYMEKWVFWVPYLAFIMAAFSALRLAKFNLDERQTMGFIGLPTPANALFWGSFVLGAEPYLLSNAWSPALVIVMVLLSSWLMVSEIPMFALKFKTWGWKGNEIRYTFLLSALLLIVLFGIIGIALTIIWYVVLSLIVNFENKKK